MREKERDLMPDLILSIRLFPGGGRLVRLRKTKDVDVVEGPRPQTSQPVRGAVRPDWDLPTSAIRGVVDGVRCETCLSLCGALPAGFAPLDGPNVDSVEDTGPQASQHVRGAVRADWDLLTRALWRAVGEEVAIDLCLGVIPRHPEAGLCFISRQDVSRSVQLCEGSHDKKASRQQQLLTFNSKDEETGEHRRTASPDVDGVERSGPQAQQSVRGAVASHGDLGAGASGRGVAQHVAADVRLDQIPRNRGRVLGYFSGDQLGRSIDV
ncbi:hypothetical protein EYF80_044454 [Liparis tanakae]|uniref:Uncharacterized protein n=1 Tax=Liparis tanakae TaxID=230148 RepID=A0A4Z2FWR3_9TELE|nr:hypothetical protein EYF80_044454 [Liparis tanakae]